MSPSSSSIAAEPGAVPAPGEHHDHHPSYLVDGTTVKSWLLTLDHKRIGVMYLIWVLLFFLVGGIYALVVRLELLTPGPTIVDAMTYNRAFTMHGVVMIFLFMIPAIPGAFGNFMLPLMLGAKDVAFPRLNLLSLYLLLSGAAIAIWGMLNGGMDTGWTFYTPYSTHTTTTVAPILFGAFIIGFSSIATGLNFIVTTHTMRAPGITWFRMPLFVWAMYATACIQVLATPVLGLVLLLVVGEQLFQFGIFDPARGGDPVLFQHLFWFYSHPAVYIMVLPAFGVMSEVVAAFSRKNIFGYRAVAFSSLGIAFVGFFAWGHHMFVSGQSTFNAGVFAVLTMLVGVFTAIKVFNWVGTVYKGAVDFKTPFAYFCGFLYFTVFGGMTGVAFATASLDVPWHDTYFVVAHFHFIMVGATIMAFMAALHYWFPKMFGKTYHEGWGLVSAALIILGFNATFIPQFLLGNAGMPRRYYEYPERFQTLNVASTTGATLLAFGFLITAIYLTYSLVYGEKASSNPWNSRGYEWLTESPPPTHNFIGPQPVYTDEPHFYVDREKAEVPDAV
ncbi:cytochrome c oxidase subunit I [Cystobacter fuscus]|uniref:Cytochrome c oxidase subunit I n=1 Tax=Cystobacter fuscus TaxID=43 RepID=A0A250JIR3_9BACT|nr:cbb3-type cytochrome c oxidase subunit I [Cystobacter fuscus]ATB43036.1 cytochrome c oxidase subunit I [Cystobacter fuscus]